MLSIGGTLWCATCWAFIVASIAMGFAIDGWIRTKDIQHDSGFDIKSLVNNLELRETDQAIINILNEVTQCDNCAQECLSNVCLAQPHGLAPPTCACPNNPTMFQKVQYVQTCIKSCHCQNPPCNVPANPC